MELLVIVLRGAHEFIVIPLIWAIVTHVAVVRAERARRKHPKLHHVLARIEGRDR